LQSLLKKGFIKPESIDMARVCQITGKRAHTGNNVSHANNRTRRKFYPNLHKKRFFIPEENKWITLKVSANAIKTINKKGITAVLKEAKAKGTLSI
jgi:large subunit ribosomal protein L28